MGERLEDIWQCAGDLEGLLVEGAVHAAGESTARGEPARRPENPDEAAAVATEPPTYLLDNLTITQRLPQGAALLMETRVSTMCSELGNSRVSTSPDDSGQALVLLPGRYPGTSQRAHLDLPEADGDGSSGGETFDHRAGDEIQQEPWPAEKEY